MFSTIAPGRLIARSFIIVVSSVVTFGLAGCSDRRPEIGVAKADFSRLYLTAEVVSVRVSEDEVIARTFAITYRHQGESGDEDSGDSVRRGQGDLQARPGTTIEIAMTNHLINR